MPEPALLCTLLRSDDALKVVLWVQVLEMVSDCIV